MNQAKEISFRIRGVTYTGTPCVEDFERMSEMGVNSIRTWGVDDSTTVLMDFAFRHNMQVILGIPLRHGRPGAEGDDDFDWIHDHSGKEIQFNDALAVVEKFKNHPALLGWGIGNEVTLNITTLEEKVSYALFLEKISTAIKNIDSKSLIASFSAWTTDIPFWNEYCHALDYYGVNVYGYSVFALPEEMKLLQVDKPFIVGEFGPAGEWNCDSDTNGIKIEPTDREKFEIFAKEWENIENRLGPNFRGGFLFNFGTQLDFAGIWLNFFINKSFRPGYWGARKAFTGRNPEHQLPEIAKFDIISTSDSVIPDSWILCKLMHSVESPKLNFYYNQRIGSRENRNAIIPLDFEKTDDATLYRIQVPSVPAPTKLYAFVEDEYSNLAISSVSILVKSEKLG